MKRKLSIAVGVSMLAIIASTLFAANAWADGGTEDKVDLWQLVAERMGNPEYYDSEVDGAYELEDWALLDDIVASELGISVGASGGSGGGVAPLTGACSTAGGQITCTVTAYPRVVLVGRKSAPSDDIIMCESSDGGGSYTQTGSQTRTTETYLQVIGTSGTDRISIVNTATSVTGCSFQAFPSGWFTNEILVNGMDAYDWIYGSNQDDTLYGEYVLGYRGDDYIGILVNESGTEYAWGSSGDDTIVGTSGIQKMSGEGDDDTLYGASGDDRLEGGSGNDTLYGDNTPCNDAADKDTILGGDGDDALWGNCGDDKLDGQGGTNDVCRGGTHLTGGGGIGDGCDETYDCEIYSECEYDWSWD